MSDSMLSVVKDASRLLSPAGRRALDKVLVWSVVAGLVDGLALTCVLAGAVALSTGTAALGLPLVGWIAGLAVLAAAGFVMAYFMSQSNYTSALDIMRNSHKVVGDTIARLPLGWFSKAEAARYSRTLTKGMMDLGQVLAHLLGATIAHAVQLVVLCVVAWLWNPVVAAVFTVALVVYFAAVWLIGRLSARIAAWQSPSREELSERLVEYAAAQKALRSSGRATRPEQLDAAIDEENRVARLSIWGEIGVLGLAGILAQAMVVILIVVVVSLTLAGRVDPYLALAFVGVALRLYTVVVSVAEGTVGVQSLRRPLRVLGEILDAPQMPEPAESISLPQGSSITFDHVAFGYEPSTPVLRDVSFTVAPRTMTALVGPSGSGKTTVARLISRFYDVDAGAVRIGGVDVRDLTIADLMQQLSMVFQDVYLYDDTLLANIRVGNPAASDDDVRRAAASAGVDDIVDRLPDGWRTTVGEGGSRLSGGERQRVSIARALVKGAPIVLIDEATSALDAENEANITAVLESLRTSSTLLVIAHKLNTIEKADQIVVLDHDGHVAQVGTHADLKDVDGIYRSFWLQRDQAEGWQLA